MENTKDIKQFVANICDKNYSEASKSLQKMIENKLKDRIRQVAVQKNSTQLDK